MNTDAITQRYLQLRDEKKAIEARHKEELVEVKRNMDLLEAALLKLLQAQGAKSIKTAHGTPYISELVSTKVVDWDGATLPYIIEHQAWDLLVRNVNKTAIISGDIAVPGVDLSTTLKLNVRSA